MWSCSGATREFGSQARIAKGTNETGSPLVPDAAKKAISASVALIQYGILAAAEAEPAERAQCIFSAVARGVRRHPQHSWMMTNPRSGSRPASGGRG
jgi:hypothetical protein